MLEIRRDLSVGAWTLHSALDMIDSLPCGVEIALCVTLWSAADIFSLTDCCVNWLIVCWVFFFALSWMVGRPSSCWFTGQFWCHVAIVTYAHLYAWEWGQTSHFLCLMFIMRVQSHVTVPSLCVWCCLSIFFHPMLYLCHALFSVAVLWGFDPRW